LYFLNFLKLVLAVSFHKKKNIAG